MATEEEARWKVGRVKTVKELGAQRPEGENELRMATVGQSAPSTSRKQGEETALQSEENRGLSGAIESLWHEGIHR